MPAHQDSLLATLRRLACACALSLSVLLLGPALRASDFTFLHTPPESAAAGQDLVISGAITNAGRVRKARLRYRRIGESGYQKTALKADGGDRYTAVIPGREVQAPGVEYFVVIQDVLRQPHLIYAAPDRPARVQVQGGGEASATADPPPKARSRDRSTGSNKSGRDSAPTVDAEASTTRRPFETAEEYELRTGKSLGGSAGSEGAALPILPPLTDADGVVPPGQDPDLLDEFAVFSAEDSTSLAASYSQKTSDAPAIISVVSRQRIEQMGARTLLDVLKTLPGVETSRDVSGFDRVAFRGVRTDAEMLLLVDGHRFNNFYDGRPYWAIPADIIERVEVIRGPGSALYGTSAFMGVVNVVTRETLGFWADGGFGSFLTPFAATGGGLSTHGFTLYLAADASYTGGPRLRIDEDSASSVVLDRRDEDHYTSAWGFKTAASVKGDYIIDALDGGKVYGRGQVLYERRGPYFGRYDIAGPDSQLSWLVLSGDVGYRQPILDGGAFDLRLYGDQQGIDQTFQLTPYGYSYPVDVDGETRLQEFAKGVLSRTAYSANTLGVDARVDVPILDINRLVLGSQIEYLFIPDGGFLLEMNRTPDGVALTGLAQPDATRIALDQNGQGRVGAALYLQDEWQIVAPLLLTLGVRLSYFSDVAFDPLTHITPRVGLVWQIVDDLNLKLLYATAFRAPTFEEKYDQTPLAFADFSPGVHLGNPELLPEFIQTGETGLTYNFTFAGFRYRLGGNAFYTQIRKAIDRIDESGTQELLQNSGGRDIVGAEFDSRVEFTAGSYMYATFGWFRAWQQVFDPDTGEVLPEASTLITDVPQYRLNIGAHLEIGEIADLHVLAMFGGERRNNMRSTLESLRTWRIPAYSLVNMTLRSKPILDLFGFELALFNVLDYPYLDDVPRPDRVIGLLPREGAAAYLSVYLHM